MESWKTAWKEEFDDSINRNKKTIQKFLPFLIDRNCNNKVQKRTLLSPTSEKYFQEFSVYLHTNI